MMPCKWYEELAAEAAPPAAQPRGAPFRDGGWDAAREPGPQLGL